MTYKYRCSRCRTRNTFKREVASWRPTRGIKLTAKELRQRLREIGGARCRDCGYTCFYRDKERATRASCHCAGAYHWGAHRPGSPHCERNPRFIYNRRLRAGESPAELAWDGEGGRIVDSDEAPF